MVRALRGAQAQPRPRPTLERDPGTPSGRNRAARPGPLRNVGHRRWSGPGPAARSPCRRGGETSTGATGDGPVACRCPGKSVWSARSAGHRRNHGRGRHLNAIPGRLPAEIGPHDQALYVPAGDVEAPVLSIVVPALNEEAVVGTFVDWCHEGLAKAGVPGEVLIVDSSTDRTPEIVLARGGRVLKVPKRGLGRAYIDAVPFIRGQWVLMGDADCTYDFRELGDFVRAFEAGNEFVDRKSTRLNSSH